MLILNLLISSIIVILGIIIGTQNGLTFADLRLLWWTFDSVSLSVIIFESFIAGLAIVLIVSAAYELKQGMVKRGLRKKIKELQAENAELSERIGKMSSGEKKDE